MSLDETQQFCQRYGVSLMGTSQLPETNMPDTLKTLLIVVKEVGLPYVLIGIGIGIFVGAIPSVLTSQHEQLIKIGTQLQALALGTYEQSYEQCRNLAEKADTDMLLNRMMSRCDESHKKVMRRLQNLEGQRDAD